MVTSTLCYDSGVLDLPVADWRLQLESAVGLNSHSKTRAGRPVFEPAYITARPLALPMPLLSSGPIAIGVVVIIRTVLLDTLR